MSKHSRERASQRYNLNLSYADEKNIIEQLKQGKGIPLNIDSGEKNKKFAYVVFNNIPLKVLYERSNAKGIKNIITIYPFDCDEYNEVHRQVFDTQIEMAVNFLKTNGYIVYRRKKND